jgi:hypothetical protein
MGHGPNTFGTHKFPLKTQKFAQNALRDVLRGLPSSAPQSASRQHHWGPVWVLPGCFDGEISGTCSQWTDLGRFDGHGGGLGALGRSYPPP